MNKDIKIANLRVFAILSVVFAHSVILYTAGWGVFESTRSSEWSAHLFAELKKFVAQYHMPLFMSISGYLFYFSSNKKINYFSFLGNKTLRLLVPYLFAGCAWMIPARIIAGLKGYTWEKYFRLVYKYVILGKQNGHLWYLIALFIIFAVAYFIVKLSNKISNKKFQICFDCAILIASLVLNYYAKDISKIVSITGVWRACLYLFWFYLGYVFSKYFELTKKDYFKSVLTLFLAIITVGIIINYFFIKTNYLYNLTLKLAVVVLLYIIVPNRTNKAVSFIEKNSFGLYLFHSPLIYIVFARMTDRNPLLVVFLTFVVCSIVAILFTMLLRKLKLGFFIGEKVRFKKNNKTKNLQV